MFQTEGFHDPYRKDNDSNGGGGGWGGGHCERREYLEITKLIILHHTLKAICRYLTNAAVK